MGARERRVKHATGASLPTQLARADE